MAIPASDAIPVILALDMTCVTMRASWAVIPAPVFEVGNAGFLVWEAGENLYQIHSLSLSLDYALSLTDSGFFVKPKMGYSVFHFTIRRDDVVADMAVVGNPYVYRFLAAAPHELVEAEDAAVA